MKYRTIDPLPHLAPYVRFFWVYEGEASAAEPYIYRGYADGCAELIFHYRGVFDNLAQSGTRERSFAAGIHAQTRTFSRSVTEQDFGIFGCYVYPFAIPLLFGLPATDFTDNMTDFASVAGADGRELEERMLSAESDAHRVEILSGFLERRLMGLNGIKAEHRILSAVSHIIQNRGLVSVTDISARYFFSHRQFERKFKEMAGFPPKTFSRIIRFQSAIAEYGSGKSLTEIAHDCGYYDQSHFINDFKAYAGFSPKVYFAGGAEGSEYLNV